MIVVSWLVAYGVIAYLLGYGRGNERMIRAVSAAVAWTSKWHEATREEMKRPDLSSEEAHQIVSRMEGIHDLLSNVLHAAGAEVPKPVSPEDSVRRRTQ